MSIVIVGGNECMARQYKNVCSKYNCKAKVYAKTLNGLKNIGTPDLLVIFTGAVSHKMMYAAINEMKGHDVKIARSHTSSITALKGILEKYIKEESTCQKISL